MKNLILFTLVLLSFASTGWAKAGENGIATMPKADYLQIILYGQSLGQGWEAARAITTTPVAGNYMLGDCVLMKYNNDKKELNPLIATTWPNGGEQPLVSCVNVFSEMYRNKIDENQKFIAMTAGEGGQTIEQLSKDCTNPAANLYQTTFLRILDNTLQALVSSQSTVACPAILFMQGEWNCAEPSWYEGRGLTPGTNATTKKAEYKTLLLKLKNDMQADIMQKYGQDEKPVFFIYQTSGMYIKNKEMDVPMAQVEFAEENDDVVLLNPHYGLPDYGGGHLSTNGYRWFGELAALSLANTFIEKNDTKPVCPEQYEIKGSTLTISYQVPYPPLVFDTYTTIKMPNYGFTVYTNKSLNTIENIQVVDGTKVEITCRNPLAGNVEIVYAGQRTVGTGNLRDSNPASSYYSYYNDSGDSRKESYTPKDEDGLLLYGQPYPLQNWAIAFYKKIEVLNSGIDLAETNNMQPYPNPAQTWVNLPYYNCNDRSSLSVYNTAGVLIFETKITSSEGHYPFDTAHLAPGIYTCNIVNNNETLTSYKFIIR